ncbi:MAG: chlorite dismutase family protein [Thermoproteota archaeon]|nr:chlorite dismutase family protein [Thermoproteota archaeon]
MKKVFVNGYGSIGSRIIQFLKDDPEIELVGVGKYSPDSKVTDAINRGFKVYVPEKNQNAFSDFTITGNIEAALDESDLVIDASPGGIGFKNKKLFYEPRDILSIYQGGETIDGEKAVSDLLFNSKLKDPSCPFVIGLSSTFKKINKEKLLISLKLIFPDKNFEKEINGKNNPLELGLQDLIDFNKGCYLGQETISKIYLTVVGKYIMPSIVYFSSTRPSIYAQKDRIHSFVGGLEAKKYTVVYPFIKTREWYLLPLEQRKAMMDEHIKVSQKYPQVELNTTYSFGIHDQDFMLAFESDDLNVFQDMIMELRGTKVSAYVKEDTPMIVCVKKDIVPIITSLG